MKKFFSSSLIVSLFLFISKLLGFARDLLLASFFGSGASLQAFLIAFRFPEFMRKVTSSGIFTQIINPYINTNKSSNLNKQFIVTVLTFLAMLMLFITLIAMIFSGFWVDLYAQGFVDDESMLELVRSLFVIMIPYMLFNCVMGLISAVLNSYKRYLISSLLPIILNVVMIVGIVVSPKLNIAIYSVAYSVLVAGVLQLVIGGYSLIKLIGAFRVDKNILLLRNKDARIFLKKLPTAFLGTAILQINALVETFFASFLISGSLAWLYYADRVNQFLYGVFGTAIATVMIPYLLECKLDEQAFIKTLKWIIRFTLVVTIPAIVGLFILAKPIVISLFFYGKFKIEDVNFTYLAMLGYLLSLFCFVIIRVIVSALYAKSKSSVVFYISVVCLITILVLDTLIIQFFKNNTYGFIYLAVVSSGVSLINLLILSLVLCGFNLRSFISIYLPVVTIIRIVISCVCMAMILNLFNLSDSYWIALSMLDRLKHLTLIVFLGLVVYLLVMLVLGGLRSLKTTYL
ncbi:multidrug transporter [Candidatus Francisella endociliophora]|uniref:Probable lipid II flippase MurJ n=1 Tax=Candidatus Francisella endociliophora TaxID=653937 RepID=A0A097EQK4_9GAMM|nr:murein biosynthesis integral membrane protein MurJ [Francisella sp. FSC1006]AIT09854.1 multidrug transporter [Francisella sp. FSC1006]